MNIFRNFFCTIIILILSQSCLAKEDDLSGAQLIQKNEGGDKYFLLRKAKKEPYPPKELIDTFVLATADVIPVISGELPGVLIFSAYSKIRNIIYGKQDGKVLNKLFRAAGYSIGALGNMLLTYSMIYQECTEYFDDTSSVLLITAGHFLNLLSYLPY